MISDYRFFVDELIYNIYINGNISFDININGSCKGMDLVKVNDLSLSAFHNKIKIVIIIPFFKVLINLVILGTTLNK